MRPKRLSVYCMTILLAVVAAIFCIAPADKLPPLFFLTETDSGTELLHIWKNDEDESFVFLPSYVNLDQLWIRTKETLLLDELPFADGASCEDILLDREYNLPDGGKLTLLRSENLPALYIDTASGNMEYIHQKKGNREAGSLRLYTEEGKLNYAGSIQAIRGRGNSTFLEEKKPYSLTLSQNGDLLGMGSAKNWILLGNPLDPSNLKNKLVYDFAAAVGMPYSPESRFVDLYLNGNYAGLYLLSERNEVHEQRIDLPGGRGFLVSKEQIYNLEQESDPYFETDAGVYLRQRYNTLGQAAMEEAFRAAEDAIQAEDGVDPITGKHWTELIDLDSWVGKYLIEEIFGGIDAGIASQYFFYQNGKIYAGPVWDYDETMGSEIWLGDQLPWMKQRPEMFYAHRQAETPWFHKLYYDDLFYSRMTELYWETFLPQLNILLEKTVKEQEDFVKASARMNQVRYQSYDPEELTDWLHYYMTERVEFLTKVWSGEETYIEVHVDYTYDSFGCKYAIFDYALLPGETLPEIPDLEGHTWYITGTDTPFDKEMPIYETMGIELRPD